MRHEAAIELRQEIVRQPFGAVRRLRLLQPGPPAGRCANLRRGDAVAPAGELAAQHAESGKRAARARPAPAGPPRPHYRAVAAVAGEELVAALAGENDLDSIGARGLGELPARQDRVVG